jgi:hypothetical protein
LNPANEVKFSNQSASSQKCNELLGTLLIMYNIIAVYIRNLESDEMANNKMNKTRRNRYTKYVVNLYNWCTIRYEI